MALRTLTRWLAWLIVAFAVLVIGLHVVNAIRIDATGLDERISVLLDRAEDLSERASADYQDLALARLPPNPNNGPHYRFDDNLYAARKAEVAATSPVSGSEFELNLEFDNAKEPQLVAANGQSTAERRDGNLFVTQRGSDYLTTDRPLRLAVSRVSAVILRARADKGNRFQLAWAAEGEEGELQDNKLSLDLIADGEFHTYIVNAQSAFRQGVDIDENISVLGITPSNVDGATVEIDYLRIVSKYWKYQTEPSGTSYETVDDELRPVLHMIPGQTLEYSVDVPPDSPEISFGTAALSNDPPVQMSISVNTDSESTRIFDTSGSSADAWQDQVLDLDRWKGQAVRIVFGVSGSGGNVAFWSNPMVRSAVRRRFNVIVVLEDTLRADHLSTHGYARETSPFKTRFMNERGVVFLNAHSQSTKTRPSIASLMTSLYSTANGVWNFTDMLSERYLTMAEILRAQGYVTASFLQNGNAGEYAGAHQGFSTLLSSDALGDATEDILGGRALDWLDENSDRNFFLYLHAIDPHGKYNPPPPYDRWYREAPPETLVTDQDMVRVESLNPVWADENLSGEGRRLLYDGEIRHNDTVIDDFIQELGRRGLLEDTLLLFTSDHGEWLGELGRWEHTPPGNRPVIHVPLMMSYPKAFPTPRRIDEAVQLIDVMPTILDLASVESRDLLMHGDSLVSLIDGTDPDRWRDRVTVSEEPMIMRRESPCACGSLFFDQWQLHGSTVGRPGRWRSPFIKTAMYEFREDGVMPRLSFLPDLYIRYLRVSTLKQLASANLEAWRKVTEGQQQNTYTMDPATLEALRGLGYVN